MLRGVAPNALRTPISRVRSVTATSMMFMMPMPPTRRLTAAMPASSSVKVWAVSLSASRKSAWLRMRKLSAIPVAGAVIARRAVSISAIAGTRESSDVARDPDVAQPVGAEDLDARRLVGDQDLLVRVADSRHAAVRQRADDREGPPPKSGSAPRGAPPRSRFRATAAPPRQSRPLAGARGCRPR